MLKGKNLNLTPKKGVLRKNNIAEYGTMGKASRPHLMNLAVHVIPLHFVTAFPLEYSHCTEEKIEFRDIKILYLILLSPPAKSEKPVSY